MLRFVFEATRRVAAALSDSCSSQGRIGKCTQGKSQGEGHIEIKKTADIHAVEKRITPSMSPVDHLGSMLVEAMKSKPAQQFYAQSGTVAQSSSPDALAAFQKEESAKWGKIIQAAGIQPE